MVKFRDLETENTTVNLAGGQVYDQSPKLELVSLLLTSFVSDKYYSTAQDQLNQLQQLVHKIPDKKFIAKAAIFARNEYGMRSITHALVGELASVVKNEPWLKNAIDKSIRRPDDIMEIVGYYLAKHKSCGYKKGLSAALRKGINSALGRFDEYQLAKYRAENSKLKLVDIFNLTHPKPATNCGSVIMTDIGLVAGSGKTIELTSHPWCKLITGQLKSTQTWESKLSQAGQEADNDEQLQANKATAWKELILENKLGYFALLRNLRNIIEQAPEVLSQALVQLTDPKLISKSLVLPFRYLTAIEEISKIQGSDAQRTIIALSGAAHISLSNVPVFPGKTLIALDTSGSMVGKPVKIGSLFTACLFKNNDSDVLFFADKSAFVNINKTDSLLTMAQMIEMAAQKFSGGTNFHAIFHQQNYYDRIIILSDMQAWVGHNTPKDSFNQWRSKTKSDPYIHSFDLAGHGTMQFPERKVCTIAGFSEKTFNVMKLVESDRNALINKIEAVEL